MAGNKSPQKVQNEQSVTGISMGPVPHTGGPIEVRNGPIEVFSEKSQKSRVIWRLSEKIPKTYYHFNMSKNYFSNS